jgi:hypothetical protein
VSIVGLQQVVLRYLARHDPKLAKSWFEEQTADAGDARAARQLDFAVDLARDGSASSARSFAEQAVESNFSRLDLRMLLVLLHRLRLRDQAAADSLFVQALGKLVLQPRVSADDLLLIGNYLFINDADADPDNLRYTQIRIDNLYFPVGILGERTGLSRQVVGAYLQAALTILTRQLSGGNEVQFPKRYEAVARMLSLKAQKYAPEFVSAFSGLARDFSLSEVRDVPRPDKETAEKLIDYDNAYAELEKLQGTDRDERCLQLAATAYSQNDLDTALKLANLLTAQAQKERVRDLIDFRRANNQLEKGLEASVPEIAAKLGSYELSMILHLGLAALELKNKRVAAALPRLQTLVTDIRANKPAARALYLLSAVRLLAETDPTLALQALNDAARAFNDSTMSVSELSRREHLTKIRIGKATGSFSVDTKAVQFGVLSEPLLALYRKSPQETVAVAMNIKNERYWARRSSPLPKKLLGSNKRAAKSVESD